MTLVPLMPQPFDDGGMAEPFPARNQKFNRELAGYRRFDGAAEALRFATEEMPPESSVGTWLEVEDERLDAGAMGRLYDSAEFPLALRRPVQVR